jgi:histidine phosphotransferase ChpT
METPMPEKPDLAALLGSRICHDLISPIGAISNGVELMMMDGAVRGPEMALVSESVDAATARIRFFRISFGTASPDQRIGKSEVKGILADAMRGRLTVDWQSPADLSRREVKLAFLLIQCVESAMPYGGKITVDLADAQWTISSQSPKLRVNPDLWEVLSNPAAHPDIGPAQVHFLLAAQELAQQGLRLTADIREAGVRLSF